jgi:hypothetical protein
MNVSKLASPLSLWQFNWDSVVLAVAAFWLSSSLLLDFLLMPIMYESGMMMAPNFATAGYSIFWLFNRVEMLCGAAILSGLLVLRQQRGSAGVVISGSRSRWALMLGGLLLAIALTYTYVLTPQMGALGIHLGNPAVDPFAVATGEAASKGMNALHSLYWGLEALKLFAVGWLIKLCYRDVAAAFEA